MDELKRFMLDPNKHSDICKNLNVYYEGKEVSHRITRIEVLIDTKLDQRMDFASEKKFIELIRKLDNGTGNT